MPNTKDVDKFISGCRDHYFNMCLEYPEEVDEEFQNFSNYQQWINDQNPLSEVKIDSFCHAELKQWQQSEHAREWAQTRRLLETAPQGRSGEGLTLWQIKGLAVEKQLPFSQVMGGGAGNWKGEPLPNTETLERRGRRFAREIVDRKNVESGALDPKDPRDFCKRFKETALETRFRVGQEVASRPKNEQSSPVTLFTLPRTLFLKHVVWPSIIGTVQTVSFARNQLYAGVQALQNHTELPEEVIMIFVAGGAVGLILVPVF